MINSPFRDRMPTIYAIDGVVVCSSLNLPFPPITAQGSTAHAAIEITYADGDLPLNADPTIQVSGGSLTFNWVPMGICTVSGGAHIQILSSPNTAHETWTDAVLNDAMAVLLNQRGALVLHASAVAVDGHAVIFAAESGFGKSTTAAALSRRGHPVLSDDKVALYVDPAAQRVIMYPTVPRLKLLPESYRAVGGDEESAQPIFDGSRKFAFAEADSADASEPLPVVAIYILRYGDDNTVEHLSAGEVIVQLSAHAYITHLCESYNTPLSVAQSYMQRDFAFLARALPQLNVRRLIRRQGLDQLPELARFIEDDVRAIRTTPPAP